MVSSRDLSRRPYLDKANMFRTRFVKPGYSEEWVIATERALGPTETVKPLDDPGKNFREWRLLPNPAKTKDMHFYLNNNLSNKLLKIFFDDGILPHNKNPKYLKVTLERILDYKLHLVNTTQKTEPWHKIVRKLCVTSCGSLPPYVGSFVRTCLCCSSLA